MKRFILLGLVLILLVPRAVTAGDWNVYLNASSVYRITSIGDSLWCATNGGILLFDLSDSTFTQYADGLGFGSNYVRAVTVDENGSVWAGFDGGGVVRIDDIGTNPFVKRYGLIEGVLSDNITCLTVVGGDVYYGSDNGVAKFYDNFHSREPGLTDRSENKYIHDMFASGDTLWIASEDGVIVFDRSNLRDTLFALGNVTSLCEYGGHTYCAGDSGIQRYDGAGWSVVVDELNDNPPLSIASGGGELFCATVEMVYSWNGYAFMTVDAGNFKDMLHYEYRLGYSDILKTVAVDSRGIPWVGGSHTTNRRGVYIVGFYDSSWHLWAPDLLSHNEIVELDIGTGGDVWVSTSKFGISYRSGDGDWISYTKMRLAPPYDDNSLSYLFNNLALLYDSQGFLWCNAPNFDLDMIKVNDPMVKADDEWAHFSPIGGQTITSNSFVKAKEDPAGNRWFLSDDDDIGFNIVSSTDTTVWLSIDPSPDGLAAGKVFDCVFDERGWIYLALRGYGVQSWITGGFDWASLTLAADPDGTWMKIIGPESLASTDLWAIERDNAGGVWIGTSSGLVRYRAGVIDSLTRKASIGGEGLIGGTVYDLELDRYGNMWVATNQGLNKIGSDDEIETFTSEKEWKENLQYIYPSSVISPLPSSDCRVLCFDEVENVLWIGTIDGLARLNVSPPVQVEIPLSDMILYPNPLHISRGDMNLRIGKISDPVSIEVYSVEGELVHEARDVADGEIAWDLLTLNGYRVRSGVYIVRVSDGSRSEFRKVAVVR